MKIKSIPENIGEYLAYDETSPSFLRWQKLSKHTSTANVGESAGTLHVNGYFTCCVKQKSLLCHRIVFFLHHGYCPDFIDHADGNRQNNNINNLRSATIFQNTHNQKITKRNTSGTKGITVWNHSRYPEVLYWRCRVTCNKKEKVRHFRQSKYSYEYCVEFIKKMRYELHGDFSNNG